FELLAAREPYVSVALNAPPSKLYVSPDTPVMVIEPVATVQGGCVGDADGANGDAGCRFKVVVSVGGRQPAAFFATMVCELPAANEPYVRVALNAPPSK